MGKREGSVAPAGKESTLNSCLSCCEKEVGGEGGDKGNRRGRGRDSQKRDLGGCDLLGVISTLSKEEGGREGGSDGKEGGTYHMVVLGSQGFNFP